MQVPDIALCVFILLLIGSCIAIRFEHAKRAQRWHVRQARAVGRWCVNAAINSLEQVAKKADRGKGPELVLPDNWQERLVEAVSSRLISQMQLPFAGPFLAVHRTDLVPEYAFVFTNPTAREIALSTLPAEGFRLDRRPPYKTEACISSRESVPISLS